MFTRVAERTIESALGATCYVIPAGVEGYSTDQELQFFQRDLLQYRPTLTVLFFYFNDVWCNGRDGCHRAPPRRHLVRLEDGDLVWADNPAAVDTSVVQVAEEPTLAVAEESLPTAEDEPPRHGLIISTRRWLNDNSKLYALARRSTRMALGMDPRPPGRRIRPGYFARPLPRPLHVFRASYDAELERAWQLTERLILELAYAVEASGSEFVIFHVPPRWSIHPKEWERNLAAQDLPAADWQVTRVEARLADLCTDHELECSDPSDEFRDLAAAGSDPLYLLKDPHWNVNGHRAVGEILADLIVRHTDSLTARHRP